MARVLVVDDNKDVLDLIKFLLVKEGHQVVEAADGVEALERIQNARPDVIVLDVMMPNMDGFTLNARLEGDEELRRIPVIVLTAKGAMREVFEMAGNVTFFVEKPFDPSFLREKIQEALSKAGQA
jgi:CheY-like chemotaxis protein